MFQVPCETTAVNSKLSSVQKCELFSERYQTAVCFSVFVVGEQLLQAGEVFSLRPLQLYGVSQQLRLAKPTCCNGDARTDLGHILDFTCRLRYLKVTHLFI